MEIAFKHWLLIQESIHIQGVGGESFLGPSRESGNGSEFSYAAGEYWSSFSVRPYAEHKEGYANLSSSQATIIGIVKTTPIEAGNGADRAFIKGLSERLKSSGRNPIPYREGDNVWTGAINSLEDFEGKEKLTQGLKGDKDMKSGDKPPEMGKSSAGMTKVSSVGFSRESGSWAFFFRIHPGSATFEIGNVEKIMKDSAKPMIDNDIMDFWQLVRGNNYGAAETAYSARGKREQDEETDFEKRAASYMKFLADRMLANHPNSRKAVNAYLDHGKFSQRAADVGPNGSKVPMEDLRKYITTYHHESPYLNFFLDVIGSNNDSMYEVLEDLSGDKDPEEMVRIYKTVAEEDYDHIVENPLVYMTDALQIFRHGRVISRHSSGNFEKFRREYEEYLNEELPKNSRRLRERDLETLKELSAFIKIRGEEQIRDLHSKAKEQEEESRKKEEDKKARDNDKMELGRFMYMNAETDSSWKHIPDKYINGDDVEVGELAIEEDIVDREDISQAAHEKASEEASLDAEERKSVNYGEDREEVESDIDYEWDEYVEDRFSDGEFEDTPEDEIKAEIKRDHFDDFVDWKKKRLEKEEEEESWRYDPQPEDSDIWKHEKSMAEKAAYENGLVIFKWPDDDRSEIDVWVDSKHFSKARDMVRRSLAIGMSEKDEYGEPLVRKDQSVVFVVSDEVRRMRAREV